MSSQADVLETVISSVFSCTSNAEQSQSNQWIFEFVEKAEAWTAAIQVINKNIQSIDVGSSGYICFFAANIIYTKVKKHWELLSSSQQFDIINAFNVILNYIISNNLSCSKAFLDRFLLSYICMAMKSGVSGIRDYITTASQLININDISLNNIPISSIVGLDMLVILPLELESSDISNKTREAITTLLVETVENVLKLCNDMSMVGISALPTEIQALIQSTIMPSTIASTIADSNSSNYGLIVIYIFKLLKSWLQYGISLSKIFKEHYNLINVILITLHTGGNWSLNVVSNKHLILKECCVVLHDIVTVQDYPVVQTVNNQSILFLLQHIVHSIPSFGYYFIYDNIILDNEVENTAYEICNCLVAVIVSQLQFLSAHSSFNIEFFNLLLSLASIQPRKIAMLTFDVWIALQDIPIAERHAYLAQDVFSQLLNVVLVQGIYPVDYDTDNCDDFDLYRDNKSGIHEIMLTCAYSLQDKFYQHLHTYLLTNNVFQVDGGGNILSTTINLPASWRFIEIVLYSLTLASDAVKSTLRSENSQFCHQFINFILQTTLTNLDSSVISLFPSLRTTICQFIGSIVYMVTITSSNHINPALVLAEYYVPALKFSFFSLFPSNNGESNYALYAAAGKTVYQLFAHGSSILTTSIATDNNSGMLIYEIVNTASTLLPSQSKKCNSNDSDENFNVDIQQPYLQLIEGLTRVIVTLPTSVGKQMISILVEPLLSDLQRCVLEKQYLDRNDHRQIENTLVYVSKIIRFCDLPMDPTTNDHLLSSLLSQFWDIIAVLESHERFLVNPKIVASIFDLYTRMLHSVGPIMLPYLPHISNSIINIFNAKGQASASSLLCAGNIIELLIDKGNEEDAFSFNIFSSLTQVLFASMRCGTAVANSSNTVWGYEVDCIEEYFNFVHKFLRFYPYIITNNGDDNSQLVQVVEIMLQALSECKEKGPLRVILQVIQALFTPNIPTNIYLPPLVHYGQKLTAIIFYAIDGGIASVLLPNLVDTLFSIVKGCDEVYKQQCQEWCQVIMQSQVMKNISIEMKQRILHHMFRFVSYGSNDGKKYFKLLLHDTSKICCGELASDALLAYDSM
jgi:hypothetical protein